MATMRDGGVGYSIPYNPAIRAVLGGVGGTNDYGAFVQQEIAAARNTTRIPAANAGLDYFSYTSNNANNTAPRYTGQLAAGGSLITNVPAVKAAYFRDGKEFMSSIHKFRGNSPTAVQDAMNMWSTRAPYKGLIKAWNPPAVVATSESDSGEVIPTPLDIPQYPLKNTAFQFQYNPNSIAMSFSGMPDVDISMYTSGLDQFNLMTPPGGAGAIAFSLIINRMFDMQYYESTSKNSLSKGALKKGVDPWKVYGTRVPGITEQNAIYQKGTMYDVEYLLGVLLGFQLKSQLRGELTSDIGFVGTRPVELHLGNKLRYLVFINDLSVSHNVFDERMVPLFSEINITGMRIPDYDADTVNYIDAAQRGEETATTPYTPSAPTTGVSVSGRSSGNDSGVYYVPGTNETDAEYYERALREAGY